MNAFTQTLRSLGPVKLATMVGVAAGILAFFIYLTSRLATPDMALLYGDLDSQDSGQIVSRLEQMDLPYKLGRDGNQIYVPSDQVARMRIAMAEEGLPSGGTIGYEIFDRSEGLGTTNFVQNINNLRALEGELARTITSIEDVKKARVHLVLPQREVFQRERQEPSASIVLTMYGSRRLDRQQVQAILQLVAAAVPDLKPNSISIVDNQGTLLARGAKGDDADAALSNVEEIRSSAEQRLSRTIEQLIERSVGPGNVRVEVTAEMDFDRITENTETYDPDGQVVRSTQVVEESTDNQDGQGLPPVTVGNNLPDPNLLEQNGDAGSQSRTSRIDETVNYEISRKVTTLVRESGLIKRLSVAVLVNGSFVENADGERVYEARSPEELEQFATLARSTVGYDEARGDTIEVVNMRFFDIEDDLDAAADPRLLGLTQAEIMRIAEIIVLGIVAMLVILLVVRPLVGRVLDAPIRRPGAPMETAGLLPDPTGLHPALAGPELPGGAGAAMITAQGPGDPLAMSLADPEGDDIDQMIDLGKVEGRVKASSLRKISEIVEKHPDESVAIVRTWLNQEN